MTLSDKFVIDLIDATIEKANKINPEYADLIMETLDKMDFEDIIKLIPAMLEYNKISFVTANVIGLLKSRLFK